MKTPALLALAFLTTGLVFGARTARADDAHPITVAAPSVDVAPGRVVTAPTKSNAPVGGIVLLASWATVAVMAGAMAGVTNAAVGDCSLTCTMTPGMWAATAGDVLLFASAAGAALGGTAASIVLFATSHKTTTARRRARWMPTFDASAHGGSVGLRATF